MEKLYPLEADGHAWKTFRIRCKKKVLQTALCAGILLGLLGILLTAGGGQLEEDGTLRRNSYGEGAKEVSLEARIGEERIPVKVEITERLYTRKEMEALEKQAFTELQRSFLGENDRADHVTEDLRLPEKAEGYPFHIEWESGDELAVSYTGMVGNGRELKPEGETVVLQAIFSYHDWSCMETFPIRVFPRQPGQEELERQTLLGEIQKADAASAALETLPLPVALNGKQIIWKETKTNSVLLLPAVWAALCVAVWWNEKDKVQKEADRRKEELTDTYAELVSKLLLLLEAGLSLRNALGRISGIYAGQRKKGGKKNYAYEEVTAVCREIEKGVPEREAYRHLGMRIEIPSYRKLAALLNQNNRLGAVGFREQLQEEAGSAWEERKAKARQKGEEAGTRLLFPMLAMLLLVLVFIMLPAYTSFTAV